MCLMGKNIRFSSIFRESPTNCSCENKTKIELRQSGLHLVKNGHIHTRVLNLNGFTYKPYNGYTHVITKCSILHVYTHTFLKQMCNQGFLQSC